jgi:hypothetical protein
VPWNLTATMCGVLGSPAAVRSAGRHRPQPLDSTAAELPVAEEFDPFSARRRRPYAFCRKHQWIVATMTMFSRQHALGLTLNPCTDHLAYRADMET